MKIMTTDFGGRNEIVQRPRLVMVFLALLLFLAFQMPMPSSARLDVRRAVMSESEPNRKPHTIREIDLIPYHYLRSPRLTLSERVEMDVQSSRERADYFASKVTGTSIADYTFPTPIFPDQGSYIMEISLGTPPVTKLAIADTGSDLVWVQCAGCTDLTCFQQPGSFFDPQKSSSYSSVPCINLNCLSLSISSSTSPCGLNGSCLYHYGYADLSTTNGSLATETFTFTSNNGSMFSVADIDFGCGTNQTGNYGEVDGLVGLGRGSLSLVTQLGNIIDNIFSYCLGNYTDSMNQTSTLILGSAGNLDLTYTPLITDSDASTYYYVNLVGITVQGTPVQYPSDTFKIYNDGSGGFILDSGTTFTMMAAAAYTPFTDTVRSLITYPTVTNDSSGLDYCYNISGVANPVFPTVVMQFEDVEVKLPAQNLFVLTNTDIVCLAFASMSSDSNGPSIFGNIQMQNFQIAFDIKNGKVGFAPTTCTSFMG